MIKRSILVAFLVFTLLLSSVQTRRLSMHFEDEAKAAQKSTTTTTTTETNSKTVEKTAQTKADAEKTAEPAPATEEKATTSTTTSTEEKTAEPAPATEEKATTSTTTSTEEKTAEPAPATEEKATTSTTTSTEEKTAEPAPATEEKATTSTTTSTSSEGQVQNVPISELQTMTTAELTLNLSNIKFPDPKAQGDILNLSSISIYKSSSKKCRDGYILSADSKNCRLGNILLMLNLDAANLIVGEQNLAQLKQNQEAYRKENPTLVPITCPAETPFLSRQGCIACAEANPYFSIKTLRCSKCPDGATYNAELKNCEKEEKTATTTTTTVITSGKEVNPQEETKNETTTIDTKDETTTIKEPKKDTTATEKNETTTTTKTETTENSFVSNVEAENYLVAPGQTFQQFKNEVAAALKENSNTKVCPADKPYSTGSECISCPSEKPYFFIGSKTCVVCQPGSTYNSDIHSCVGKKIKITAINKSRRSRRSSKTVESDDDDFNNKNENDE